MSLKQKIAEKKAPQEVVFDVPGMGELTFRVRKVKVFEVLEKEPDVFSAFAKMQGISEDKEISGDSIMQGLKVNRLFLHLGVQVWDESIIEDVEREYEQTLAELEDVYKTDQKQKVTYEEAKAALLSDKQRDLKNRPWLSFDYEETEDAFLPEDLLDQETMNKLVGMVAGSFR